MFNGINNFVQKIISSPENQSEQEKNLTEKKIAEDQNTKVEGTPIKQRETKDAPKLKTSVDNLENEIADAMSDSSGTSEESDTRKFQEDLTSNNRYEAQTKDAPKLKTSVDNLENAIEDAMSDISDDSEESDIRKSQENLASNNGMNDYVLVNIENKNLSTEDLQKDDNNSQKNLANQAQQSNELNENLTSRLQFYANQAYELLPEINKDHIGELLYRSYKVIFNNDRDVAIINELVDMSETKNTLKDDTIYSLANLDATHFHSILMSQIIAKNENIHVKNNFIEILSNILANVKQQSSQTTDEQSIDKLLRMVTSSLKIIIQETLENITDLNKTVDLSEHIKLAKYYYESKTLEFIKTQFIKDALRKPGICLQLMQGDKVFWDSNDSKELQQLSKTLDNDKILTEELKVEMGEKFFAIYSEQIDKYLAQNNIENHSEVAKLILLELTQAGTILGTTILMSMGGTLTEKLAIPDDYHGIGKFSDYKRSDSLIYQDNNLVLKQSILFSPGFMVQDPLGNKIATTKDINVASDLQINPSSLKDSKYDHIKISMGK